MSRGVVANLKVPLEVALEQANPQRAAVDHSAHIPADANSLNLHYTLFSHPDAEFTKGLVQQVHWKIDAFKKLMSLADDFKALVETFQCEEKFAEATSKSIKEWIDRFTEHVAEHKGIKDILEGQGTLTARELKLLSDVEAGLETLSKRVVEELRSILRADPLFTKLAKETEAVEASKRPTIRTMNILKAWFQELGKLAKDPVALRKAATND